MPYVRSYEIGLTYRCNLRCNWCNRLVGVMDMPDTDMTAEEVAEAGRRMAAAGVTVSKVKMSGGQPTVNPQFGEICKAVDQHWPRGSGYRIQVLTNGAPAPNPGVGHYHVRKSILGKQDHKPFCVSPLDLGIQPCGIGYEKLCKSQELCGRYLDKFGFNFCPFAGVIGRVVGVDSYSAMPVLNGVKEICQHCVYSLQPRHVREQMCLDALEGRVPQVTETFRAGINRWNSGPQQLPYFLERTK